ncbi:MAG: hypothetical protein P8Y00_06270 [Deltaproteobacteria bacterium]
MRFTFHSIRISILTQLAFLILAAMLLISVVMLTFQEHTLIQEKLKQDENSKLGKNADANAVKGESQTIPRAKERLSVACFRS